MRQFLRQSDLLQKGLIALGVLVIFGWTLGGSVAFAECGDYVIMMGAHHDSAAEETSSLRHSMPSPASSISLPGLDAPNWRLLMPLLGDAKGPTTPCNSWSCRQNDSVKLPPVSGTVRSSSDLPDSLDGTCMDFRLSPGAGFPRCSDLGRTSEGYLFELEKPPQFS